MPKKTTYLLITTYLFLLLPSLTSAQTFEQGLQQYEQQNYRAAFDIWEPLAEAGNADAQFGLGVIYSSTENFNAKEAAKWFRAAAEQGHIAAQYNIGNAYEAGRGVDLSYEKAVFWWTKAADQGNAPAQFNLGTHYFFGRGVKQNSQKAAQLWEQAAVQNHVPAQFNLATYYNFGLRDKKDTEKAMYWYRIAARNGHTGAQKVLLSQGDNIVDSLESQRITAEQTNASDPIAQQQAEKNAFIRSQQNNTPSTDVADINNNIARVTQKAASTTPAPQQETTTSNVVKAPVNPKPVVKAPISNDVVAPSSVSYTTLKGTGSMPSSGQADAISVEQNTTVVETTANGETIVQETVQETTITAETAPESVAVVEQATAKAAPAKKMSLQLAHREHWVMDQDKSFYTLQLAAFRSEQLVIKYLRNHDLPDNTAYFSFQRDGQQWYAIINGSFSSKNDATRAIDTLPKNVRSNKPWIRRFSSLQDLITK